jgi:hypothetical protein
VPPVSSAAEYRMTTGIPAGEDTGGTFVWEMRQKTADI